MSEPSVSSDDEAALAEWSAALLEAVRRDLGSWLVRVVEERRPDLVPAVEEAAPAAVAHAVSELETLLHLDIDQQRSTPLTVLRRAARVATQVLVAGGTPMPHRDAMAHRIDPDDLYELGPATFADVSRAVGDAGISWGAAKAFVHLRRRR